MGAKDSSSQTKNFSEDSLGPQELIKKNDCVHSFENLSIIFCKKRQNSTHSENNPMSRASLFSVNSVKNQAEMKKKNSVNLAD